jgi:hypothetical protein
MIAAVAVQSYLDDSSGGAIVGAVFGDDDAAQAAVDLLSGSGVRPQDISVIARDRERATQIAGERAWTPHRRRPSGRIGSLLALASGRLPRDVRRRYGKELARGQIVVLAVAGGQPTDTLRALFDQAGGASVDTWWSKPVDIFAPPELAGPF